MKKTRLASFAALYCAFTIVSVEIAAQTTTINVAMKAESWEFQPQKVEFLEHKSKSALKILPGAGPVILKELDFTNGTIEFDFEPLDPRFATIYFRWQNAGENECFYFRTARAGNPTAEDAVQYTPGLGGTSLWDMLGHFQGNASFQKQAWNHIKLVVSGAQMRAYVNSESQPTLAVPRLEGNVTNGRIVFEGEAIIANLVIKPNAVEGLSPLAGIDPTDNEPRYLRYWRLSPSSVIPKGIDFSYDLLPKPDTAWTPIEAERRGLINLTRKFGKSESRRIAWLKTTLKSASAQTRKLAFGFSDEVWALINGKLLYVDKNWYTHPIRKEPDGRCSIENTTFNLPLNAGDNELLIGVANDFYGWGIVARIDSLAGITVEPDRINLLRGQRADTVRLLFDQAHGEQPPPGPMGAIAKKLGLEIQISAQPINAESLKGVRILYLRAPSKEFAAAETEAIVAFVKGGGSLLLVLDEERRQSLEKTGVNNLITLFGMRLTPDTEYLHNCGGIAKAGEINKADRELPFSGGRAVEGGTAFAFQLDKDGKPAQPFGAYKRLDNGARIVALGEGMASLFLGAPNGVRLTGVPNDPTGTTYWGKDSAIFMEELLMWLSR